MHSSTFKNNLNTVSPGLCFYQVEELFGLISTLETLRLMKGGGEEEQVIVVHLAKSILISALRSRRNVQKYKKQTDWLRWISVFDFYIFDKYDFLLFLYKKKKKYSLRPSLKMLHEIF